MTEFESLIDEVSLAPSVHNIQPGRWRQTPIGYELFWDRTRVLPLCDPNHRDIALSLGVSLEGLRLALARRGQSTTIHIAGLTHSPVATVEVFAAPDAPPDPLLRAIDLRQCFRGMFRKADADQILKVQDGLREFSHRMLTSLLEIREIADLYETANLHFLREPGFAIELNQWLRFTKLHPRFGKDGLNAEAMNLSVAEACSAAALMQPRVLATIDKLGQLPKVLSERLVNQSAAAVFIFLREPEDNYFQSGMKLYRYWLKMTLLGFSLTPLSALSDYAPTRNRLREMAQLPPDTEILLAFRGGPSPIKRFARARRDLQELKI